MVELLLMNIMLNANNLQEELLEYLSGICSFITVLNIPTKGKPVEYDYEQLVFVIVFRSGQRRWRVLPKKF